MMLSRSSRSYCSAYCFIWPLHRLELRAVQFQADGLAEHVDLHEDALGASAVFDDAFQTQQRAAGDTHAHATLQRGKNVQLLAADDCAMDVDQLPVQSLLIENRDDVGDALGAIGGV